MGQKFLGGPKTPRSIFPTHVVLSIRRKRRKKKKDRGIDRKCLEQEYTRLIFKTIQKVLTNSVLRNLTNVCQCHEDKGRKNDFDGISQAIRLYLLSFGMSRKNEKTKKEQGKKKNGKTKNSS